MTLPLPADGMYFHEDLTAGVSATFGTLAVSRDDIIAFATAFDPQPVHLDEVAAKASILGGLCASGMHSCALMMRLLCDHFLLRSSSLGSPGLDEVKWLQPVRPGDLLSVRISVLETRVLQSRPDVGISKMLFEVLNQTGAPVLAATTNQMMRRRHSSPTLAVGARASRPAPEAAPTLWDVPAVSELSGRGNYFEDVVAGDVFDLGAHTFERDEIIAFARQFDPQAFHLDEEAGKRSLFGGLAASGWHTAAIFIRQIVAQRHAHEAQLRAAGHTLAAWGPSPGFRNLLWLKPVMKGDRIEFRNKVIEARALKSRPSRGLVISQAEGRNQRGEIAFKYTAQIFAERRAAAG